MKWNAWLFSFGMVWSTSALAMSETSVYLGAGESFSNLGKVTHSDDASNSLTGTAQLFLSLSARFWDLKPGIFYTPIARKGHDNTYLSRTLMFDLPVLFYLSDDTFFKFGPSYWMHTVKGSGGTLELSNGTGTSTFTKPTGSSTAKNLALTAGIHLSLMAPVGLEIDVSLLAPFTTRRSATLLAQLTWSLYE